MKTEQALRAQRGQVVELQWVRLKKYCADSGDTAGGVENRLRTGKWLRGIHARVPDGSACLWVNLRAVNDWAEGKKPAHLHGNETPS